MRFMREFSFPVDRLLPNSRIQAMKELLRKSEEQPPIPQQQQQQEQEA